MCESPSESELLPFLELAARVAPQLLLPFDQLLRSGPRAGEGLELSELAGSAGVRFAVELALAEQRTLALVCADPTTAAAAEDDAEFFAATSPNRGSLAEDEPFAFQLLVPEDPPWRPVHPERRAQLTLLAGLARLVQPRRPGLAIIPAHALLTRVCTPALVAQHTFALCPGAEIDRDALATRLVASGYLRVPLVEDRGTFALRGGLIDVWSPAEPEPMRLVLSGDELTELFSFDPDTQRSVAPRTRVTITLSHLAFLDEATRRAAETRLRECVDAIDFPSLRARPLIDDVVAGRSFPGAAAYLPAFGELCSLLDYFPEDTPILFEDTVKIERAQKAAEEELCQSEAAAPPLPRFRRSSLVVEREELAAMLARRPLIGMVRTTQHGAPESTSTALLAHPMRRASLGAVELPSPARAELATTGAHARRTHPAQPTEHGGTPSSSLTAELTRIKACQSSGLATTVICRTTVQRERLASLLRDRGFALSLAEQPQLSPSSPPRLVLTCGSLARGVVLPEQGFALFTDQELLGPRRPQSERRRPPSRAAFTDIAELRPGDAVVHVVHGIGRYLGLERKAAGSNILECLAIDYLGGRLYLPVTRLNQISKHAGSDAPVKLDRLGGVSFAKTRERVKVRLRELAESLLQLYAERLHLTRPGLPPADHDFTAFEASFPFEETPDQAAAILDVMRDLESTEVMDRLVCGDVGFGKTEVAMRAAFRMAIAHRQVAILVPTTVLCQQHLATFRARLEPFGIEVRALSRFTSQTEQREVLRGLIRGTVDVVVGTHRLLSKDVAFHQLGLLVIDEEQRFGVSHKERIKQLRATVDVLTLSATPIPRTLQLATSGLRDLSMIATPPADRKAIRTLLGHLEPRLITEAISRELARGGQVYYVSPRIEGLAERAAQIQASLPEARVTLGHGKLPAAQLERAWLDFSSGRKNVLVSTAIIENGLDVPRANTMVIEHADRFGLSQLYQLRGRIGRSKDRAYCYLLVPSLADLSAESTTRLETLERFTELGSGFRVAALDLELRGAGDVLGAEQSGFIAEVGFELFAEMLREAADELRGLSHPRPVEPELGFDVPAFLPDDYIPEIPLRLTWYKSLAQAPTPEAGDELAIALEERFGPPPPEAHNLLRIMRNKPRLIALSVLVCDAARARVSLHIGEQTPLDGSALAARAASSDGRLRLTPDGRVERRAGPSEVFRDGISHLEQLLTELEQPSVT